MYTLIHYPLCPFSRSIRLVAGELKIDPLLVEEHPHTSDPEFFEINPAGTLPVMIVDDGPVLCGPYAISEYLSETRPSTSDIQLNNGLFPGDAAVRAETRRLVDWFHVKFYNDVSICFLEEKIYKSTDPDGTAPDIKMLRAAHQNLKTHLRYIGTLSEQRNWLSGEDLSFADLAAAAQLSCLDYLGDVPWDECEAARIWYARVKSRPSFQSLLRDRVPGLIPSSIYTNLDF